VPGSQANLSQLESYRVIIAWKLTGKTTDGKNVEEQTTYTQALHRPSNTSYTLVVENKPGAQGTRSEIYSVGDTLYIYEKDRGVCQPAMMAGMGDMLRGITDSMTAPLRTGDAKLVNRGETINGMFSPIATRSTRPRRASSAPLSKKPICGLPAKAGIWSSMT
jgi:hypothetical protein